MELVIQTLQNYLLAAQKSCLTLKVFLDRFYLKKKIPSMNKVLCTLQVNNDLHQVNSNKLWKVLREVNFHCDEEFCFVGEPPWEQIKKITRKEDILIIKVCETCLNEGHSSKI